MKKVVSDIYFTLPFSLLEIAKKQNTVPSIIKITPVSTIGSK